MDFAKVLGHGAHEAAGSAANFECAAGARMRGGDALQLPLESCDDFDAGVLEFAIGLVTPAKGDVIIGIFAGAGVPVLAHALFDLYEIGHCLLILASGLQGRGEKLPAY